MADILSPLPKHLTSIPYSTVLSSVLTFTGVNSSAPLDVTVSCIQHFTMYAFAVFAVRFLLGTITSHISQSSM